MDRAVFLFPRRSNNLKNNIQNSSRKNKTRLFSSFPPFKLPSFIFVLRVITAKCVILRCKV